MSAQIAAFTSVSAVVTTTPGKDTLLTIRNAVHGGRAAGVCTAAGVVMGLSTWTVLSGLGVVALILASDHALRVLQLAGAGYLVILGGYSLWSASRRAADRASADVAERHLTVSPTAAFRQGFVSNLSNPKIAVFFTTLLPRFARTFFAYVAFGFVFCAMTLVWLTAYAVAAHKATRLFRRPEARRIVDLVAGITLVGLGVRVATEGP